MSGDLDPRTVIRAGGWDARFARVLVVRTVGERAAAVIDADGDGADIDLEHLGRVGGSWRLLSSSGGAGDRGTDWHDGVAARYGVDEHGLTGSSLRRGSP